MDLRLTIALFALAGIGSALDAGSGDVDRYRKPVLAGMPDLTSVPNTATLPEVLVSVNPQVKAKQSELQPQSRLEIVRYVSGEFAKVRKPIPAGKAAARQASVISSADVVIGNSSSAYR